MNARFCIFISIIVGILSLASVYVGMRFIARSVWAERHFQAVWLSLGCFIALQLLATLLYRLFEDLGNRLFILHWIAYLALGVFACVFFYTLAADLLTLGGRLFFGAEAVAVVERWAFLAILILTAISA